MLLEQLEKEAMAELDEEKKGLAKDILKDRIREIAKTEAMLKRLRDQYTSLLSKPVHEVADEVENGNIRY